MILEALVLARQGEARLAEAVDAMKPAVHAAFGLKHYWAGRSQRYRIWDD
jgi:hypothetical protein